MLQSLDKQTGKCSLVTECRFQKSSIKIYKLTKVPLIFNKKSVRWNLNKRMLVSQPVLEWIKHFSNTTSMIYLL